MENHHAINGKIHYKWPFLIAMWIGVKNVFDLIWSDLHEDLLKV